jgi:hypothetical protein
MTCEFLVVTDEGEQEKAGSITFTPPGGITVKAAKGYGKLMDNIASGRAQTGRGQPNQAKEDPAGWFESLPEVFSGTYLRCHVVDDAGEAAHAKLKHVLEERNR